MSIETGEKLSKKPQALASSYFGLCNMLSTTKQFDEFFIAAKQMEKFMEEFVILYPHLLSKTIDLWILYASAYENKGEYDKAEYYCDLIDNLSPSINILCNTISTRSSIAEARGEYTKALDYINSYIEIIPNRVAAHYQKIRILSKIENAPLTWEAVEATFLLSDSLMFERIDAQLDELRTQYEVDRHIIEKERNRNYFLFALGGCALLLIALGIWMYFSRKIVKKNRGLYRQIKEQDRLAEELKKITEYYDEIANAETLRVPSSDDREMTDDVQTLRATSLPDAVCAPSLPGTRQQRQLVSHLNDYLLKNKTFANYDLDLQEIVPELATNRTYLFEALKAVTGKTPMEYINHLRLDEAKRLLHNTMLTIETIAEECGFNTSRTFYRLFRERYKISPTEYRKMAKENVE
jgi:AraC-like DNA-binding protein